MAYTRPDTDAIRSAISDLDKAITEGAPASELLESYYAIYDRFGAAESAMSLAYLLYAFDVTQPYYEEEYAYLQSELNALDLLMTDISIRLFESSEDAKRSAEASYGEAFITTVYEQESLNSEEIQALQETEVALVNEYNRASNDFRFTDNGVEYTYNDLFEITDTNEFSRLCDLYNSALNSTVGPIFLKQVQTRNEIAKKLGYGSYAAYMYDCYGRDFTLADAKQLQEAVKTYIVPVYLSAYGIETTETYAHNDENMDAKHNIWEKALAFKDAISNYIGGETAAELGAADLGSAAFSLDTYLDQLQGAAADFSPELYTVLQHMLQCGLYDFSVNPKKMAGSFTTYISEYNEPFIFSQWENSSIDISTVIHELGHFTNYYRNPSVGWSAGDNLDLAEVDSQGLELLMIPYYDRFYGDLAPYAERDMLCNAMYALLSGCMEDEFQQAVYEKPDMTLAEMNALYKQLSKDYGFDVLYSYTGKEWVEIPHTFQSPLYYISYAASMVPSLALWRLSQTDAAAAKTAYFQIVDRPAYATFRETVAANGLPDVFTASTLRDIAALIQEHLQ